MTAAGLFGDKSLHDIEAAFGRGPAAGGSLRSPSSPANTTAASVGAHRERRLLSVAPFDAVIVDRS
jgi:hypothetical protein